MNTWYKPTHLNLCDFKAKILYKTKQKYCVSCDGHVLPTEFFVLFGASGPGKEEIVKVITSVSKVGTCASHGGTYTSQGGT